MTMFPMCPHRHILGSYCPHCPDGRAEDHVARSNMPDIAVTHKHGYDQGFDAAIEHILGEVLTYDNLRPQLFVVPSIELQRVLHRARKEVRALLPDEEEDDGI